MNSANIKTENNETKEVGIKNRMGYYFDDIIKVQDFDFDNIYLTKNHVKEFLFMTFHEKLSLVKDFCVLCLIKWMGLLDIMMELYI